MLVLRCHAMKICYFCSLSDQCPCCYCLPDKSEKGACSIAGTTDTSSFAVLPPGQGVQVGAQDTLRTSMVWLVGRYGHH